MPAPTITALPTAPQRSDEPATFVTLADAWVAAIDGLIDEINDFGSYLDGLGLSGTSWKGFVRVATTANGTLASAFANGQTVDGVVLATGDRILIKDQSAGAENGIYTVAASGAPTRATDMDGADEVRGAGVYVIAGTTNGGKLWFNTNTTTPTLGSTALTFAQFTGGGSGTVTSVATAGLATGGAITTTGTVTVTAAVASDLNTGTSTSTAVTPDALAGSNFGKAVISLQVTDPAGAALTTGDGKAYYRVPSVLNGMNLVGVAAALTTVSSSGIPTVQIANVTQAVDMLTTKLTIDASELDSKDATTAAVIDTGNDDVATGDMLRIDIDVAGTGAKGLIVEMQFQLP
jgi:hypothetical protein